MRDARVGPVSGSGYARTAAGFAWVTAVCFGLPAVPVAVHLARTGSLPMLLDLFPMYAGPWSERLPTQTVVTLLVGYLVLNVAVAVVARAVWRGSRPALGASAVLMAAETVFWIGFALPIPWIMGAVRAAALALAAAAHRRS